MIGVTSIRNYKHVGEEGSSHTMPQLTSINHSDWRSVIYNLSRIRASTSKSPGGNLLLFRAKNKKHMVCHGHPKNCRMLEHGVPFTSFYFYHEFWSNLWLLQMILHQMTSSSICWSTQKDDTYHLGKVLASYRSHGFLCRPVKPLKFTKDWSRWSKWTNGAREGNHRGRGGLIFGEITIGIHWVN